MPAGGGHWSLVSPAVNTIYSSSHSGSGRPSYSVLSNGGTQHGSNASLASNCTQASSHAPTHATAPQAEEVYKHEIRKLQSEVDKYRDKVSAWSSRALNI